MNVENLKNEIVEKSAAQAVETANTNIEAKASELDAKIEAKATEMNETVLKLANAIDKLEEKASAPVVVTKSAAPESEFKTALKENLNEIKNLGSNGSFTLEVKDASNFTAGAGPARAAYRDVQSGIISHNPNQKALLRDYIPSVTSSNEGGFNFNEETAIANTGAAKAKGGSGTDTTLTLTKRHTPFETLISTFTVPKEWLDDTEMFEQYLSSRFLSNLMDVENSQLLVGTGTSPQYTGLNVAAPSANRLTTETLANAFFGATWENQLGSGATGANRFDVLTAVKSELEADNFVADLAILHPNDYYRMSVQKANTGEYVLQQTIAPDGTYQTFWNGMRVVASPAQSEGTFTILDSSVVLYTIREGASFEFGYSGDDFKRNNLSVKAMIRGGLSALVPAGIVTGTFAACITSLNT